VALGAFVGVLAIVVVVGHRGLMHTVGPEIVAVTFLVLASQVAGWLVGNRAGHGWTGIAVQLCGAAAPLAYARFVGYASPAGQAKLVPGAATVWLVSAAVPAFVAVDPGSDARRRDEVAAATSIVVTAIAGLVVLAAAHGVTGGSSSWWSLLPARAADAAAHRAYQVHAVLTVVAVGAALLRIRSGWRSHPEEAWRGQRPVAWCVAVWGAAAVASELAGLPGPSWAIDPSSGGLTRNALLVLGLLPVVATGALVAAVAWRDVVVPARSHPGSDVAGDDLRTGDVASYVGRALADPSVRVVFADAEGGWVDAGGRPVRLAEEDPDRLITTLVREGRALGAIECDVSLAAEPEAIELVATPAGLAIDTEQLASLAQARVRRAQQLTARLLTSSDAVRDQLRAELDAGPVRELDEIAEQLQRPDDLDLDRAATQLRHVSEAVRAISRGLLPPELFAGGLASALPDAATAPSRRLPAPLEVTAFLLADGHPGARLVDEGASLVIDVGQPPQEPTVLDRIEVLGGAVDGSTITLPVEEPAL
jgi:hypothetical protein